MDEKKFQEIIRFAIDKEIKSYNFYADASKVAKYSGTKDLFSDLSNKKWAIGKCSKSSIWQEFVLGKIDKVPDLKISDYMVDVESNPDMSYADILRKAMKIEERSLKLYNDIKKKIRMKI